MKMLILVLMTLFVLAFIAIETLIGYKRGIIKEAIRFGCIALAVFLAFMCTRHSLKVQTGVINETLLYAAGESDGQNLSDKEKDAAEYVNNTLLDLVNYDETDTATASIKERIVSNLEVVFTSFTAPVLAVVYTGIFACLFILFKLFAQSIRPNCLTFKSSVNQLKYSVKYDSLSLLIDTNLGTPSKLSANKGISLKLPIS